MSMGQFRDRQDELRRRASRLPARSLVRQRLERELRGLVVDSLKRETTSALRPVPEQPEDDEHHLRWWQR